MASFFKYTHWNHTCNLCNYIGTVRDRGQELSLITNREMVDAFIMVELLDFWSNNCMCECPALL